MKILVVGHKGQVGNCLAKLGPDYGFEIIGGDLPELDICSLESVRVFVQKNSPGLIINAAAYTAVDKAEEDIEAAYLVNDKGVENLAIVAEAIAIPVFHISTDYIFDGISGPYKETDEVNPLSIYGASKLAGEISLKNYCSKTVILRTCWLFSEYGNNFLKSMINLGRSRDSLSIVADQYGAPTSAEHVAQALLELAKEYKAGKEIFGTYHFSGQPYGTWYDFAAVIFASAEKQGLLEKKPQLKKITTEEYPLPAPRPKNSRLECGKINNLLPQLKNDWISEVERCIKTLKEEGF